MSASWSDTRYRLSSVYCYSVLEYYEVLLGKVQEEMALDHQGEGTVVND